MEESFFGFDTSVPLDDDGGGGRIEEPSEEEYDALNDETFGSATNGDWESAHENMVRLTDNIGGGDSLNRSGNRNKNQLLSTASSSGATPVYMNARMRRVGPNADSDLELNLSGMKLDDVDLSFDDNTCFESGVGGHISMDPSVWSSHPERSYAQTNPMDALKIQGSMFGGHAHNDASDFVRDNFSNQFQQQQQFRMKLEKHAGQGMPPLMRATNAPKICTLEDIERNIIIQQQQQQKEQQQQQARHQHDQQQKLLNDILRHSSKTPTLVQQQQQQHNQKQQILQQQQQQKQQQQQQTIHQKGPPGFGPPQSPPRSSNNFANNLAQHPLGNLLQQQQQPQQQPQQPQQQQQQQQQSNNLGTRLPPGFPLYPPGLPPHLHHQGPSPLPPHPLLNQHGLPPTFPHPHLPVALNNFAMHPNFNAMRAAAGIHPVALVPPLHQPPRILMHPPNASVMHNQQQFNMFNMRLVQEIQQNHPMLQNVARQAQNQMQNAAGFNPHAYNLQMQQQQLRGNGGAAVGLKQNHQRQGMGNGNLPHEEYDEYANLMSTRDKHWLIGIQLSQLNTDTPFIDDYYYTVYRERKAAVSGNHQSQAHKDNQLNHPLTQPSRHAQLILVQLGNKNGTRNGQHRERRSSESGGTSNMNGSDQKMPYVFTPLKFENSLGKLQYGSVTAPRKIIDADIMGAETQTAEDGVIKNSTQKVPITKIRNAPTASNSTNFKGDITSSAQRKSRHILLHIETLYRLVLKLEDLDNPHAIATIIMKKKKESERIAALEQLENANKTAEERAIEIANPQPINPMLKNKFAYEIETKQALVEKLIAGLTHDKVVAIMNVRKGKALIRRIMPFIDGDEICWNVWMGVFSSLQNVVKKDREDVEGLLYALYPEFNEQIKKADFETIVRISASIALKDKKANGVFCSKFGISALVCLIIQAEHIYVAKEATLLNEVHKKSWCKFLDEVATSLNRTIQNQTICAAIESDSIQPLMNHFARFKDLKLDSLLALITEAKQQIN